MSTLETFNGAATFDETRRYRYTLGREWNHGSGTCLFIMLNPSTADAYVLDPTVRRCVGFAQLWGYRRLEVCNLFGWRSADPAALRRVADPVGPDNLPAILLAAARAQRVVVAWGAHGVINGQGDQVALMLVSAGVDLWCLGVTAHGFPKHPLYLPADTALIPYEPQRADRG